MMMTKQLLHERRSFSALVPFRDEPNTSIFEPLPSHENTTKIISKIKVKIRDPRGVTIAYNPQQLSC